MDSTSAKERVALVTTRDLPMATGTGLGFLKVKLSQIQCLREPAGGSSLCTQMWHWKGLRQGSAPGISRNRTRFPNTLIEKNEGACQPCGCPGLLLSSMSVSAPPASLSVTLTHHPCNLQRLYKGTLWKASHTFPVSLSVSKLYIEKYSSIKLTET